MDVVDRINDRDSRGGPACAVHKPVQHNDNKPPWCNRCGNN